MTKNLRINAVPLQNGNVNEESSVGEIKNGAHEPAKTLDITFPPLVRTPYINLKTKTAFYIESPAQKKLHQCSSGKESSVPFDGNHITSFSQEYGLNEPALDVAVFIADMLKRGSLFSVTRYTLDQS